ncbi:1-acyl-sn-glycerol-3-phosphate acyltransferase [[Phormidium ambiguum] IAM M-71]|uniref:1-acyl-sn-glycerol-3-phosphate acyltransferase n=1 Tax=[Phormidium ambiguum] IAM M-71 TaxID=454136 RepID=A0A1U7INT8_9CYAN|nr:lysophospholipid acyltransferase family protein [Phormidium ambiguum]OKH39028.1 1-acyl-sn-glycerol-3-phosphate acyltransferase [Phormidium ambiguum IAM M-71]
MMNPEINLSSWLYWSLFPIHRLFLSLYFSKIMIQGAENLPEFGPVVLAPKHYSRWDPLLISLLSREPLFFMTNANQFSGIQGWFIERLGAFPVDLNQPTISSMRNAIELLQNGKKLVLFPEGGIVRDRILRSLKPGLARLVLQAEAKLPQPTSIPIVPITLKYQPNANFLSDVFININPPIYSRDYRQANDKLTAIVLTEVLENSLIQGLTIG